MVRSNNVSQDSTLLSLTNIRVQYGAYTALEDITLHLRTGEIHAIVGEHGAGKSSTALVISGMEAPTSGTITIGGDSSRSFTVNKALTRGIRTVYQQIFINPNFSVAEHMYHVVGLRSRRRLFSRKYAVERARRIVEDFGFDITVTDPMGSLSPSDQTVVEILKHLADHPRLLILDEALERLSVPASQRIMRLLTYYRDRGLAVLFITHRIDDIYTIGDRVTILREGHVLATDHVENLDKLNLIRMTYTQIATNGSHPTDSSQFRKLFKYNEAVLKQLPVNLIVVDSELRIQIVNNSCARYFGLDLENASPVCLEDVFGNNVHVIDLLRDAVGETEEKTFYQVSFKVGSVWVVTNIKVFPIWDEQHTIGTIISVEDITDFDKMQKQMVLSEKLASVGLLAAGVAHEINNPLAIISNYLSFVRTNLSQKKLKESIDRVKDELQSISQIVSNLQSFSSDQVTDIEPFEAQTVISDLIELIRPEAKQKGVKINFDPQEQKFAVHCSRNEFKQVLLNLFKNSFEAFSGRGEITISTSRFVKNDSSWIQFRFRDNGPGIGDEDPRNVFMPFYSTKAARSDKLGLGMAVSYNIVRKYNGEIDVRNLETGGCEFTILLPESERGL